MSSRSAITSARSARFKASSWSPKASKRAERAYREATGTTKSTPEHRKVDLNTATPRELATLPGLTDEDAQRIVANRPYGSKQGLVRKNILGEKKFEQIQDYVYVSQAR